MQYLFWSSVLFLSYTFAGYPALLWILSIFRSRAHQKAAMYPLVSIVVAAYNEAAAIRLKIRNCLEQTYPRDKMEIIVASDGSRDATADIVRSFAHQGVKLVEITERRGKHHAQMVAKDVACGEILVFTDASARLEPNALQEIISNFADPSVGCVSGEDRVIRERRSREGESIYVRYEMWLRRLEASVGTLVGVSGAFFAVRRELCEPWHPDQSSDFFLVLHAVGRGLRAVTDPASRALYSASRAQRVEWLRKVRTIVHGLDVLFTHRQLLDPFRYGLFSWQLASHKLFRWLMPFSALSLFFSNLFLWKLGAFYQLSLALQSIVYGSGVLALALPPLGRLKPFEMAGFLLLSHGATLTAWWKYLLGEKFAAWQPTQRD